MKQKLFGFMRLDRRGLALISVLGVVTLATILILALFSVSDSEFKASRIYADGSNARHLAESAINIVMGQVQAAATGTGAGSSPTSSAPLGATIWASQPGAVRVYKNNGNFILGRTLYSSAKMVWTQPGLAGETAMAEAGPPAKWAEQPDQWVDLNRPVERIKPNAGSQMYYPIFDPHALTDKIEGFEILTKTIGSHGQTSNTLGVVTNGADNLWRLPMPVEWLYILKDGAVGTVSQSGSGHGEWANTSTSGQQPTYDNPIVGRVGFWTDDECCKINLNTAGEPGPWASPTVMHDRELKWADSPPAIFEYQRYPGHPATVALSSVFAPGFDSTNYYPGGYPASVLAFKNSIYSFVPKLAPGGTQDGTLPFAPDDFSNATTPELAQLESQIMDAKVEPLFASVDEALFDVTMSNHKRNLRRLVGPTGGSLLDPQILERARPFLTAHSRAPETNMFGLPRVAIWPVPDTTAPGGGDYRAYRTGYDSAIAISAKLGSTTPSPLTETANTYYFTRLDSNSHLTDMGRNPAGNGAASHLGRNASLMTYLNNLVHMTMPGGASFAGKYDKGDAEQVLIEIFDYIRCTNLYDGFLSEKYPEERRDNSIALKLDTPSQAVLWDNAPRRNQYFTYTAPRFTVKRIGTDEGIKTATTAGVAQYNQDPEWVKTGAYPGHGQVKPIEWVVNGKTLRGFGRFPTISEVALHFICTGDGKHDEGSYKIKKNGEYIYSGGKTSEQIDYRKYNQRLSFTGKDNEGNENNLRYYSNIPPFPGPNLFEKWGCNFRNSKKGTTDDPEKHPAMNSFYWNCTLDYNPSLRSGVPLEEDEKRIQVCLLFETFIPSVGYTKYVPDYTMVLRPDQVSGIKVKDGKGTWQSVFSTTDPNLVIQSTYSFVGDTRGLNAGHDVSPLGGHFAPSAITNGRQVAAIGKMPRDPKYEDKSTSNLHSALLNFPLVSNFLTVKRADGSGKPAAIEFKVERALEVDIYSTHDWQGRLDPANREPSQRVNIEFPTGEQSTPVPHLVVYSTEPREYTDSAGSNHRWDAIPCVRWWAFNYGGAINRYSGFGQSDPGGTVNYGAVREVVENQPTNNMKYTYGRFHSTGYTGAVPSQDTYNRSNAASNQGANVTAGGLIYGYSSISTYNGTLSDPDQDFPNIDTYFGKGVGKMGQYGFYGTDSVRSIIPRHGDYRMIAARKVVDQKIWQKHPVWERRPQALFAHSLSGSYSDAVVGFDLGGVNDSQTDPKYRLVPNAWYEASTGTDGDGKTGRLPVIPDTPLSELAMKAATKYRDFDNGPGNLRDGPYINKPDDGNLSLMKFWHGHGTNDKSGVQQGFYVIRNAYFTSSFLQLPSKSAFFTPNRIMSSPGMFGSLPTGVWGSLSRYAEPQIAARADTDGVPWRTLLFRADVDGHVGAPAWSTGEAGTGVSPADHYFMDLFFMPVVEPYAITDSYSTAGKINLNYQIVPFTNIKRATAVHAALKGELITAFSSQDTDPRKAKGLKASATNTAIYKKIKDVNPAIPDLWTEADGIYWHREIDAVQTLKQMDERFAFKAVPNQLGNAGLMLAASQICELHLIPKVPVGTERKNEPDMSNLNSDSRKFAMKAFWAHNDLTGDNTRERPYANLYQKFTTRSNTFRVYFTAQTLRKARSLKATEVDTQNDSITAEYRGSALFERYLDFSKTGSVQLSRNDYGNSRELTGMPSLEDSYHYRVIEMKQFSP